MRTMAQTADYLRTAREAVDIARQYVEKARDADPDPEFADKVYGPILSNLTITDVALHARVIAGSPDLEREAKK